MASTRKTALREALTFEKDIHGSCFLFLQCLALDKTLHLYSSLRHLFFPPNYINEQKYIFFPAYLRNCTGKNMVKDSTEASCQMPFVISLPFNGRRLDTMFHGPLNEPLKLLHLSSRLSFWRMTMRLHPFWREEKKERKTQSATVPSLAWCSYRASLRGIPICKKYRLIMNNCTYLICCINKFDSLVRDRQDNGWYFLHLFCRLLKSK